MSCNIYQITKKNPSIQNLIGYTGFQWEGFSSLRIPKQFYEFYDPRWINESIMNLERNISIQGKLHTILV